MCTPRTFALLTMIVALSGGRLAHAQHAPGERAEDSRSRPASADNGAETQPTVDSDAPLDFARARELFRKKQRGEKLSAEDEAYLNKALEARRRRTGTGERKIVPPAMGGEKTGLKPLTEMTAKDEYQGQNGGLYGQWRNTAPEEQAKAAQLQLAAIQPLDKEGKPSDDGRIVLLSISMSNATQEFSRFKQIADVSPAKSRHLTIVDGAQGGQAMAEWADPKALAWQRAEQRLAAANVSPAQVQVAWIKLANKSPSGQLSDHGKKLQQDTQAVLQNARQRFPNLKIAYLSSRIYGGYAKSQLNPEPYAYESAFVVRWLIQDQIKGNPDLNADPKQGAVKAPLLLWGPYLWADGVNERKEDGLVWNRDDLASDGTHPSPSGREKVARMLLAFFANDSLARSWFVEPSTARP